MTKKYFALKKVTFSFNNQQPHFFEDVSQDFIPNTLNFIHGKNGMGKSTLMRILQGALNHGEYVEGTVCINNTEYNLGNASERTKLAHHVAHVPQNFNALLVDTCSFKENLQFALLHRHPNLKQLPQAHALPACIEKYGIDYNAPISSLSGGQRQILSILMMLQLSPQIVLLDEPTATLDEENAQLIMSFLKELCAQEKITIVLIVHDKEIIRQYGKEAAFELVRDGKGTRTLRLTR